jgi:hypothetical protein
MNQAEFGHFGIESVDADPVFDSVELTEHVPDSTTFVAIEVATNPGSQVVGLADVDHLAIAIEEEIDPGPTWQTIGEGDLGVVGGAAGGG